MEEKLSSTAAIKIDHNSVKEAQYDLPQSYGKTESFLLPKDPGWIFLFWDIIKDTYEYIMGERGRDIFDKSRSVIRVYDITGVAGFNGSNSNSYFDIPVVLDARSWYINIPAGARKYICDIGIITPEGEFVLLTRSNSTTTPPGKMSDVIDDKWMMVEGEYEKLVKMSGVEMFGSLTGASEKLQNILQQRWKMFGLDVNNMPTSNMSSWGSARLAVPAPTQETDEDIWLKADCELIVYGQASKNAKVLIGDKEIQLGPDGTFSLRYSLQDGQVVIPIKAHHHTKTEKRRSITIKAERQKEA